MLKKIEKNKKDRYKEWGSDPGHGCRKLQLGRGGRALQLTVKRRTKRTVGKKPGEGEDTFPGISVRSGNPPVAGGAHFPITLKY